MKGLKLELLTAVDTRWAGALAVTAGFRAYRPSRLGAALEDGEAFAAFRDGQGVGFAVFGGVRPELELHLLVVNRADRRRGVARALLEFAHRHLAIGGHERICLEVGEGNGPARALYRALGYEAVGRREAYYPNGEAALILALKLPRSPVVESAGDH